MKKMKLSLEEFQQRQKKYANKKFRITGYPWPVLMLLLLPMLILIIAFLLYFFHIKGVLA